MNREVTETVFSSEVHSVRRNSIKSILDYDSPKSNRITNYDSILNSNNVEYCVPKSITDLDYGLPKNCVDYQSNHTTPARSMAIVSDGEVVVFDDIDDNWQGLRLDLGPTNTSQISTSLNLGTDDTHRSRIPPDPPSSSVGSTPSPTATYQQNSSDFYKVIHTFLNLNQFTNIKSCWDIRKFLKDFLQLKYLKHQNIFFLFKIHEKLSNKHGSF